MGLACRVNREKGEGRRGRQTPRVQIDNRSRRFATNGGTSRPSYLYSAFGGTLTRTRMPQVEYEYHPESSGLSTSTTPPLRIIREEKGTPIFANLR